MESELKVQYEQEDRARLGSSQWGVVVDSKIRLSGCHQEESHTCRKRMVR